MSFIVFIVLFCCAANGGNGASGCAAGSNIIPLMGIAYGLVVGTLTGADVYGPGAPSVGKPV